MTRIKILNPHGLKIVKVWPTLRAIGLRFHDAESLIKGDTLQLPPFAAGVVIQMINDLGHLVENQSS